MSRTSTEYRSPKMAKGKFWMSSAPFHFMRVRGLPNLINK